MVKATSVLYKVVWDIEEMARRTCGLTVGLYYQSIYIRYTCLAHWRLALPCQLYFFFFFLNFQVIIIFVL